MALPVDVPEAEKRLEKIIDNAKHFLYTVGTLYEFMPNGIYVKAEDHQVQSYLVGLSIKQFGVDIFSRTELENFVYHIKSKSFMRWEEIQAKQDKNLIPFKNTIFDIKRFDTIDSTELLHLREYYFFFQIPHNLNVKMLNESIEKNYTPEQALKIFAPKIYQFFGDIVGEDKVILQLAKIGYAFYPSNPFKLMFMELGPKDAGKTSFLRLFTYVVGERNIATISLQDLADYRFARAELRDKLANIYDDLPATQIRNLGILKMLSGESRIDAPVKFKQDIQSFTNTSKSIYTTNRLPFIKDNADEAFFSRWVITNYPNHFPRNDKFFSSLISNESEIEGLIVASLLALRDLLIGKFHFEDKTQENMDLWQRQNNSVYAFISDSIKAGTYVLADDLKIEKNELYNSYVDYCNEMEIDAYTKTKFTQDLQRLFNIGTAQFKENGRTLWGYEGIGIRTITQTELEKYEPPQPADTPTTTTPDNALAATKSSASPHSDTQVQASPQVLSPQPETPVPENNNVTQQHGAFYEITERQREVLINVYTAIQNSERENVAFWSDPEQQVPNLKLSASLRGLSINEIKEALKLLQERGYIKEAKPGDWYTVKALQIIHVYNRFLLL